MIVDHIKNAPKYFKMHHLFEIAFNYLTNTDLVNLDSGKYSIQGNECFAIINKYKSKNISESFAESHKKYIDIQFVISGEENLGYGFINDFENLDYNSEYDLQKHHGTLDFISLKTEHFAILFPDDIHMPGIIKEKAMDIIKVVIKIAV
jgi:YhcH/YjgK/YiaL family protein